MSWPDSYFQCFPNQRRFIHKKGQTRFEASFFDNSSLFNHQNRFNSLNSDFQMFHQINLICSCDAEYAIAVENSAFAVKELSAFAAFNIEDQN